MSPADVEIETADCECGARDCRETVSLSPAAHEALRRTHRPVLAPGHRLDRAHAAAFLSKAELSAHKLEALWLAHVARA